MKALLSVATIVAVAVAHEHQHKTIQVEAAPVLKSVDPAMPIDTTIEFVAAGSLGFIEGWYRGMYKQTNYTVDERCFGTTMLDAIQTIDNVSNLTILITS